MSGITFPAFLASPVAWAVPESQASPSPVRSVSGTVAELVVTELGETAVLLTNSERTAWLLISPDTAVWKEFQATPEVIDLGDWVFARVTQTDEGQLLTMSGESVWVNIGRRDGVIRAVFDHAAEVGYVSRDGHRPPVLGVMELSAYLEVLGPDGIPESDGAVLLTPGMRFGAVGVRLPGGGFRATRLWTWPVGAWSPQ